MRTATSRNHDLDLIDRIYEAAFLPEMWPDVLQTVSEVSNSAAGAFFVYEESRPAPAYFATELLRPVLEDVASYEWEGNEVIRMMFSMSPPATFIYDADLFPEDVLEANHVRTAREKPLGIGGQVGTIIGMPTGELAVFSMERWLHNDRPPPHDLDRLNTLRPHLARAGMMTARLRLERAQATASTLQAIGLPAAVMSSSGRVLAANALLETMPSLILPLAFGRMALKDPQANELFQQAVRTSTSNAEQPVRSIPVKARGDGAPLVVHVVPLRRSAHDIFSGADLLIAATAVSASNLVPSPSILTGLFDLAPSEARLAVALTQGQSLKAFAAEVGITFGTARKYLDRIYLKTGTHSQSQLVALLKGAQPLGGPE